MPVGVVLPKAGQDDRTRTLVLALVVCRRGLAHLACLKEQYLRGARSGQLGPLVHGLVELVFDRLTPGFEMPQILQHLFPGWVVIQGLQVDANVVASRREGCPSHRGA